MAAGKQSNAAILVIALRHILGVRHAAIGMMSAHLANGINQMVEPMVRPFVRSQPKQHRKQTQLGDRCESSHRSPSPKAM